MANSITKIYKNGVEYDIYASWGASVNTASSTTAWVVKLWSDTVQTQAANSPSSTSWKTYPIQVNNSWQEVVNVPWTDHTYTSSSFDIKDLTDSTGLRTTWSWKQDALVSWTNIKTVNSQSLLWSWNIAISWWHDYSWNTLTGTSFTLSWTNYRNLISTSSDTTVSVWTGLTPWMEYIIRITNSDSDNDHTMTYGGVEYIIPKSWTVTYKWLALTATTVEFEWPRYVYEMPATPEEWFIYYVIPEPTPPFVPWANTIAYYPLKEDVLDYSGNNNNWSWNPNSFTDGVANYSWNSTTMPVALVSSWTITVNVWFYQEAGAADFNKNISFLWQHTTQNFWFSLKSNSYHDSLYHTYLLQSGWSGYATTYSVSTTSSTPRIWWHNVVWMRDASKIYLYLDGQYQWETTYSWLSSNAFYMWYDHWYDGWAWTGKLSQLIFENRIRTATEISNYYNQTKWNYWIS